MDLILDGCSIPNPVSTSNMTLFPSSVDLPSVSYLD